MPGTLFVVATPIGNLEDVSLRALRILREVAIIAAEDTRRTSKLLAHYAIPTPLTSLHEHNESSKTPSLVGRLVAGESMALVSDAGTPTVSDPGGILIAAAIEAGVRVEPVPGPSAPVALLSIAGFQAGTFTFLGFPPIRSNDRTKWLQSLADATGAVVFFESPHRIVSTLTAIRTKLGDCQIAVGRELTKLHEEVIRGRISEVVERIGSPRGEYCVALNADSMVKSQRTEPPRDDLVAAEFGRITDIGPTTRRAAITAVSRKLGIPPNAVYAALERSRKSGK